MKKKKEDVKKIHSTLEETALDSPSGGGDDEVEKEEKEAEEYKKKQGVEEVETSKKIKVSSMKPTSRKKSKESNPKLQTVLTVDDFDFIFTAVSDASEDIL
jgi:hypothetical protein